MLTTIAMAGRTMMYGAAANDISNDSDSVMGDNDNVDGDGAMGDNNDNDGNGATDDDVDDNCDGVTDDDIRHDGGWSDG
jgi:hypothetical protein